MADEFKQDVPAQIEDAGGLITSPVPEEMKPRMAAMTPDGPFALVSLVVLFNPDSQQLAHVTIQLEPGRIPTTADYLEMLKIAQDKAAESAGPGFRLATRHEYIRFALGIADTVEVPGPNDFVLDITAGRD